MKKTLFLSVLALAGAAFSLSAETLSPYTEGFEGPGFRPKGWLQASGSSYAAGTYTVNADGGHSGGCISVDQYGDYYSTYYNNYSYNDYLITPAVSGEVSIWVKKNGSKPQLSFHKIASLSESIPYGGYPFLDGTAINLVEGKTIDDWTQVTVTGVPAGTYLGIRAHNLMLDDFSATSADVVYRAGILASVSNTTPEGTTLECNGQGEVTVKFKVSLDNVGDVDFPAEPGFKIELYNASSKKTEGTDWFKEAIPSGNKVEKEFSMTFQGEQVEGVVMQTLRVIISSDKVGEPVEASLGSFKIIPYVPVATFMLGEDNDKNQNNYTDVNIQETITVGAGAAGTSRTLYMWNSGIAPMKVTGVTLAGDFTADVNSFTLAKGEKKAVKISLKGAAGRKTGSITFNIDGVGAKTYSLLGLVTKAGDYYENFESENVPAGYITSNGWALAKTPETLAPLGGTQWMAATSTYSQYKLILPKLTFAQDENLNFMASKTDNTSSTLKVYVSKDRVEWTEVAAIDTRSATDEDLRFPSDKPTGTGYGTYEFRIFSIPMTAGDQYVALEAGGARVDNICGGKLTPVSHDLYITKVSVPEKSMVNTRFITSVSLQNLLATPEKNYDIVIEQGGEVVAHATETPELLTNVSKDIDVRFTPHEQGKFDCALVFVSGNYRQKLYEFQMVVQPEKAEATYQVGDEKITTTDPFNIFYDGSQCQILYRKADLDLAKGMKVIGTTFTGYNTDVAKKHIKVWAQNTTDERYDFDYNKKHKDIVAAKPADMTLVFEGDYTFQPGGNSSKKEYVPVMEIEFNTPFEYTGDNLRLMFDIRDIEGETNDKHVFFCVDNSVYNYYKDIWDDRTITRKKEFQEDLDDPDEGDWIGYNGGFPVTYFKVAKDVVSVHGLLTDDFDVPVKGAEVKFSSDDLLYSAKSDEQGRYFINVGNLDHVFTLSVDVPEFSPVTLPNVTLDPKVSLESVHNFKLAYIDRTATLTGKVTNSLESNSPLAEVTVSLTKNGEIYEAKTNDAGIYTITVPAFTGEYTLAVTDGGEEFFSEAYTFKSKADTKNIRVAYDGVGQIASDSDEVKVAVSGSNLLVTAPEGTPVAVYTASGILVGSEVSKGATVEFGPLSGGIYIVAGKKVVIR